MKKKTYLQPLSVFSAYLSDTLLLPTGSNGHTTEALGREDDYFEEEADNKPTYHVWEDEDYDWEDF